jgi:hypothetical protein
VLGRDIFIALVKKLLAFKPGEVKLLCILCVSFKWNIFKQELIASGVKMCKIIP